MKITKNQRSGGKTSGKRHKEEANSLVSAILTTRWNPVLIFLWYDDNGSTTDVSNWLI